MYSEPVPHKTYESTRKRPPWRRRKASANESNPTGLHLAALDTTIQVSEALYSPAVAGLMTEDFCWRAARTDWLSRRPPRWQRTPRRAWQAEGRLLDEKRSRIRELAVELHLLDAPHARR